MEINENKTKAMLINFTNQHQFTSRIQLKGKSIDMVESIKILGVQVTNTLDWSENTAILVKKVNQRMQLLRAVWGFGCTAEEMVHLWKLYCRSVLEQSCVVWGSSLSKENEEDLERVQKSFAKLVLREKYTNYESALRRLDLEDLVSRRKTLMLKFAKTGIENGQLKEFFKLRKTKHPMDLRQPDKYRTTKVHTERFKNSSIPYMERLLNTDARDVE
jgi:hypothetical protein